VAIDSLNTHSLDWAVTHVLRFGDTDIFPVPFEFRCIKTAWNMVRPQLAAIDLSTYRTSGVRRMLVPKPAGGFRVATQLNPVDAIIYLAAVYEAAAKIEANRIPAGRNIACSYRIDISPDGQLFGIETGWPEFHAKSEECAKSGEFTHVLIADIADFYSQIYSHRVQGALEAADVPSARSENIERFLLSLTAKQTRGVPVGPSASILLAEAVLSDVDSFLLRRGLTFTRYVDDFRIFCQSRRQATRIYHDLAEYLYTSHRLTLEQQKSRVLRVETFGRKELVDPARLEKESKLRRQRELIEAIRFMSGYNLSEDELPDEDKRKVVRENLVELFKTCVGERPLPLGLARYLLRRATRLRTTVLNDIAFQNLTTLVPVFRELINYLRVTVPKRAAAGRGQEIVTFLKTSIFGEVPFLRLWAMDLFLERPDLLSSDSALDLSREFRDDLGIRPYALIAQRAKKVDWVRGQKEIWMNYSPWDRRAVIYAGSVLPAKERRIWLDMVASATDDVLDKAVAACAKQG
jgi:hypothetical protein